MNSKDSMMQYAGCHADSTSTYGPELTTLRGVEMRKISRNWSLFRGAEGSDETFGLSRPVDELDVFLSHSWSGSPFWKHVTFITVLYVKIGYIIMLVTVIALSFGVYFLPSRQILACLAVQTLGIMGMVLGILFGYLVPNRSNKKMVFLDKCCIPQGDASAKKQGIYNMDRFLTKSKQLLILWTPNYFSRLWCVFELACYLRIHSDRSTRLISVPHFRFFVYVTICEIGILLIVRLFGEVLPMDDPRQWYTVYFELSIEVLVSFALCLVVLLYFIPAQSALIAQLKSLCVASAQCSWDSDRKLLTGIVEGWYGSEQEFERNVRTMFLRNWSRQHILVPQALALLVFPYVSLIAPHIAAVLSISSSHGTPSDRLPAYVLVRDALVAIILLACRTPLVLGLCLRMTHIMRNRFVIMFVVAVLACLYHIMVYVFTTGIMFSLGRRDLDMLGVPDPYRWMSVGLAVLAIGLTYVVNFGCGRVYCRNRQPCK